MNELYNMLERRARSLGADLFGVADMAPAHALIASLGGEYLTRFPRAIALGKRLSNTVVEQLPRAKGGRQHLSIFYTYRAHNDLVVQSLKDASFELTFLIEEAGYQAYPVYTGSISAEERVSPVPMKLAAHLAGLGWIGKNGLLVTPGYGPRLWLNTLLTDAPLPTGSPLPNSCGDCHICVDACPAHALTGVPFNPVEPREVRFNFKACADYSRQKLQSLGVTDASFPRYACSMCLYICPFGRKRGQTQEADADARAVGVSAQS